MTTEVYVHLHYETEKAILVSADGDEAKAMWLPKSQITFEPINKTKSETEIIVELPDWLAEKKGLV